MGIDTSVINAVQQANTNQTTTSEQQGAQDFAQVLAEKLGTTTTAQNATKTLSVVQGDTVSELAEKYGSSTAAIVQANQLQNPDLILVGQQLMVPLKQTGSAGTTAITKTTAVNDATTPATSTAQAAAAYTTNATTTTTAAESSNEAQARAYIVQHESGGDYSARNGKYIGKYQLDQSYLKGDFSAANQEKVANEYVASRYGSWEKAMQHWKANNWY
ncbi:LysM peptidoglycan-binding domain-containing protein [Liquorilactobacillus satsumensis]|uniref:aggregation-promoting factor n=1 Tax=Liquorilactobacillus satsumensis TaxID=259059 RepID=UPI0021C26690|nr:LysM peptidoglycan-binding domain-containing protein [Liquorilactobacillus satsumensis]